ncbi:hypothetical protein HK105_205211 [Polyrhizophydium stewartii]|uniref:Uncharacterized protein n=1 Tax=Polyrhizophydium stewartii TaxID=2732419 RepID=A0ABR4N7A8_9FUNG
MDSSSDRATIARQRLERFRQSRRRSRSSEGAADGGQPAYAAGAASAPPGVPPAGPPPAVRVVAAARPRAASAGDGTGHRVDRRVISVTQLLAGGHPQALGDDGQLLQPRWGDEPAQRIARLEALVATLRGQLAARDGEVAALQRALAAARPPAGARAVSERADSGIALDDDDDRSDRSDRGAECSSHHDECSSHMTQADSQHAQRIGELEQHSQRLAGELAAAQEVIDAQHAKIEALLASQPAPPAPSRQPAADVDAALSAARAAVAGTAAARALDGEAAAAEAAQRTAELKQLLVQASVAGMAATAAAHPDAGGGRPSIARRLSLALTWGR